MKIVVKDKEYLVENKDVIAIKRLVDAFIMSIKSAAVEHSSAKLYFTALLLLYSESDDLIDAIGEEHIQAYLTDANEIIAMLREDIARQNKADKSNNKKQEGNK